ALFDDTPANEIHTLSLHDALPILEKAYYAVLVNNERIALFDNNIARVDTLLRTTSALNKNGFAEEIDVDRVRVTLNNLKSERLRSEEHTSELQSRENLVCRLLLEK